MQAPTHRRGQGCTTSGGATPKHARDADVDNDRYFSNSFFLSFTLAHSSASASASLRSMMGGHTLDSSALIAVYSFWLSGTSS